MENSQYEPHRSVDPLQENEYAELQVEESGSYYSYAGFTNETGGEHTDQSQQKLEFSESLHSSTCLSYSRLRVFACIKKFKLLACILGFLMVTAVGFGMVMLMLYLNKDKLDMFTVKISSSYYSE